MPNAKKTQLFVITDNAARGELMLKSAVYFEKLASVSGISAIVKDDVQENYVSAVVEDAELFLSMDELVDKEKEIERLNGEKAKLEKELDRVDKKLSNKGFTDKAPEKVVEGEREKQRKYQEMLDKVLERLAYYNQ